ncbi:hypothetical protein PM082_003865 [Marasmius tenuissimus]|nr:hypothetical protein PM082_003865 [Marasmius tenuissimus]
MSTVSMQLVSGAATCEGANESQAEWPSLDVVAVLLDPTPPPPLPPFLLPVPPLQPFQVLSSPALSTSPVDNLRTYSGLPLLRAQDVQAIWHGFT